MLRFVLSAIGVKQDAQRPKPLPAARFDSVRVRRTLTVRECRLIENLFCHHGWPDDETWNLLAELRDARNRAIEESL